MSVSDTHGGARSRGRGSRRFLKGKRTWFVLVAAALGLSMAIPAASFADSPTGCDFSPANNGTPSCSGPLTGSTFEGGDGNLLTNTAGNTDWANMAETGPGVPGLNPGFDLPSGSADNSFGKGTKEDDPNVSVVTGSIPPNKSDLTRFYEASAIGSNSHNFLYLAWERSNVLGTANMDFEINQHAQPDLTNPGPYTLDRTAGDLLVTFDFSNGGGTPTLGLLTWLTSAAGDSAGSCYSSRSLPCWGDETQLNAVDSIGAVNNIGDVTDPLFPNDANYINQVPALQFGETAIDLTAAGVFPEGTCKAFGSAFVKSRASTSFTSEVKDFIAPVPVNISNCGRIKIIKHTDPRGKNQVFSYTSNLPAPNAGAGGVACAGNTSTGIQSDGSFCLNDNGNTSGNSTGNTVDTGGTVPAGTYHVTEGTDPPGYTFESLSCTGGTTSTSGRAVTITLAPDVTVVCTYVNKLNTATMSTQVSAAAPVYPGTAVHDTATVTGQAAFIPSGTVTFYLCGPIPGGSGSCSSGGTNVGTGTLSPSTGTTATADSPNVNTSSPNGLLAPGYYCFRAQWPGDTNYLTALTEYGGANGTNECFTVIDTTTSSSNQTWLPNDTATVSSDHGALLNGTLSVQLYTGGTCAAGNAVSGQLYTKDLTGTSSTASLTTQNTTYKVSVPSSGTVSVSWKVTFTSTDTDVSGSSHCESTSLTINN